MSQAFYQKLSNIFFGFVVLLILLIANAEFLILFLLDPTMIYYIGYLVLLFVSAFYGIKTYRDYRGFRETLSQGLFCSDVDRVVDSFELEPISEIPEDKALATCVYYHNGSSLNDIQRSMGFKHPQQARRHLLKGLDILLKEHNQKVKE